MIRIKEAVFHDLESFFTFACGFFILLSLVPHCSLFAYVAVTVGGYFSLKSAVQSLRERHLDIDSLMVFSAVGAVSVGHVLDGAGLLFLFSLAHTLEHYASTKTRSAIEGLVQLRPTTALLIVGSDANEVPVEDLKIGDRIRIPGFANIPVDGTVISGSSAVNQSSMTGESVPVSKKVGDPVLAGTQNLEGTLEVEVSATVGNSTLDRIVGLVAEAQKNKASGERISAWFGQRYTYFVILAFAASLLIRLGFREDFRTAFYQSLTVLVGLSPCAIVISSPAATLSALAFAAKRGILIRGGEFIERVGGIKTIALDKTGTLTSGSPTLVELVHLRTMQPAKATGDAIHFCHWYHTEPLPDCCHAALRGAAIAEQNSNHPIARSIVEAATQVGLTLQAPSDPKTIPGLGVSVHENGSRILVGQESLLQQEGIEIPEAMEQEVERLRSKGMTVALTAGDFGIAALGLLDTPRPESQVVVTELRKLGIQRLTVLTGDREGTATSIAQMVGINEVHAGLMPDEKERIIANLDDDAPTMMIGDGINDAPSLTRASLGVAMGGFGSDIALNAADIVLMKDDLHALPLLIRLGRKASGLIRANLFFAGGMVVVLTTWSLLGTLPLPIAVLGHEGSTVLVIFNGLRLLKGP